MSLLSAFVPTAVACAAAVLFASAPDAQPDGRPEPSPELSPEAVIRIQAEALQRNDEPAPDAGIATAFRFASPSNRRATGPLPRFTRMIRTGYVDMLGFDRAEYEPVRVAGDRAEQAVTLVRRDGRRVTYAFTLSRQRGGAYDGCWMTDGVAERPAPTNGLRRT